MGRYDMSESRASADFPRDLPGEVHRRKRDLGEMVRLSCVSWVTYLRHLMGASKVNTSAGSATRSATGSVD